MACNCSEKPVVVFSRCLGFDSCRYNGQTIPSSVVESLRKHVEVITVCPEADIGLGIPRDPVRIVRTPDGKVYLLQPATGNDYAEEMISFSDDFVRKLKRVDGFVLKYGSPSCGPMSAKIYRGTDRSSMHTSGGSGLFTERVKTKFPSLPIEDEKRLTNLHLRELFYIRIFTLARFRSLSSSNEEERPSRKLLTDFHANHKYIFMAYSPKHANTMGQILANLKDGTLFDDLKRYEEVLLALLSSDPGIPQWIFVLEHVFGGLKKFDLKKEEKKLFLDMIEEYRDERIPLSSLLVLLRSWAIRFDNQYLLKQSLFRPFPADLVNPSDSARR